MQQASNGRPRRSTGVYDRLMLKRYADGDIETYHQARALAYLLPATVILLVVVLLITPSIPLVKIVIAAMTLNTVAALVVLRFGYVRLTTILMIVGMSVLTSSIAFTGEFREYEVYFIGACHLFILSIAGLVTYRAVYPYVAGAMGVAAIVLAYVTRGLDAIAAGVSADTDDYLVAAFLVAAAAVLVGRTVTRSDRLLRTARSELEANQRRTEELQAATSQLNAVIEQSPVALVILDNDGAISRTNSAFLDLLNLREVPRDNVQLLDALSRVELYAADGRGLPSHALVDVPEAGSVAGGRDVRLVDSQGKTRHLLYHVAPITDEDDRPVARFAIYLDTTQRTELEERLRQAQKLEAVGRLAGGVAHDFNNLLTVINGYSEMLLREDLAPEVMRHLKDVNDAGGQAARLTNQLLVFARKQTVTPTVLNMNVVVTDHLKMLARLLGEHIEIRTDLSPDLENVLLDRGQAEQIITNLALNARDAMPRGGRLSVRTANRYVGRLETANRPAGPSGDFVVLAVADSGEGMDEDTLSHVFEPFFTTKGAGTGLGLATVHGIVSQNKGFCTVKSEVGQGTVFEICLPVVGRSVSAEQSSAPAIPTGSETILLVEDDDAVLRVTRTTLEGLGYSVVAAPDGAAAIREFEKLDGHVDLLLTDVIMPGISGKELVATLRTRDPSLNCVYMSGYTDDIIGQQGVIDASVKLLKKPFSRQSLAEFIRDVLDSG